MLPIFRRAASLVAALLFFALPACLRASTTAFKTASFGAGYGSLSTVGYALYNPDGTLNAARTTVGVAERGSGTGTYGATVTLPTNFTGEIRWDTGGSSPVSATEAVNPSSMLTAQVDTGTLGSVTVNQLLYLLFAQSMGKFGTPSRSSAAPWTITVPFLRMDGTTTAWTIVTTYTDSTFTKTTGRTFTIGTLP